MNLIRTLLIFLLLMTFAFCENDENYENDENDEEKNENGEAKEKMKNKLDDSSLMIDNREVQAFGSAVSSILHKAVNEFLIAGIVVFSDNIQITDFGEVTFMNYTERSYEFNHEISEILRSSHGMFVVEVVDFEHHVKTIYLPGYEITQINIGFCKGVCVLLFENINAFESFKNMGTFSQDRNIKILIMFVRGASAKEIRLVLEGIEVFGQSMNTVNEYTIVDAENGFYELLEINRFVGGGACSKTSMVTINRFSKAKLKWEEPLQRFELKTAFNNCTIFFEYSRNQVNLVYTKEGKFKEESGLRVEIMKLIEDIGRFKANYQRAIDISLSYKRDETGLGDEAHYSEQHFNRTYRKVLNVLKSLHFVNLVAKELYFVVPQGELYTEWEKLFLPFDLATWLLIIATFAAAFAVIIVINNFTKQFVKNFVFGRRVKTPSLNVLKIFFGMDQTILPRRNFARFLLTLFLIWTLIIRTCYQGLLFENLIGDGRKPAIKTIDEMLERNFTYHTHFSHCWHLVDTNVTGKGR